MPQSEDPARPRPAVAGEAPRATADAAGGAPVVVGSAEAKRVTTRERILELLDQLEEASPFASASLAEEVRREATHLRSLRRRA